jgi:hypothetical protein
VRAGVAGRRHSTPPGTRAGGTRPAGCCTRRRSPSRGGPCGPRGRPTVGIALGARPTCGHGSGMWLSRITCGLGLSPLSGRQRGGSMSPSSWMYRHATGGLGDASIRRHGRGAGGAAYGAGAATARCGVAASCRSGESRRVACLPPAPGSAWAPL